MRRCSTLIGCALVGAVLVLPGTAARSAWNLSGTWKPSGTGDGTATMTVTQSGNAITAVIPPTSVFALRVEITATITGDRLSGTYKTIYPPNGNEGGHGKMHAVIQSDCRFFAHIDQAVGSVPSFEGDWTKTPCAAAATWPPPLPDAVVSLSAVSNGCGPGKARIPGWPQKFGANESSYRNSIDPSDPLFTVNFKPACDLHDAGYSGAKVADAVNGGVVDYFEKSRAEVDRKFLDDMQQLCARRFDRAAEAHATALRDCLFTGGPTGTPRASLGAKSRYDMVRSLGEDAYWKRPDLAGRWTGWNGPWTITMVGRTTRATFTTPDGGAGRFAGTLVSYDDFAIVKGYIRVVYPSNTIRTGSGQMYVDFVKHNESYKAVLVTLQLTGAAKSQGLIHRP